MSVAYLGKGPSARLFVLLERHARMMAGLPLFEFFFGFEAFVNRRAHKAKLSYL